MSSDIFLKDVPVFNQRIKLTLYRNYIRPTLEYANVIFSGNRQKVLGWHAPASALVVLRLMHIAIYGISHQRLLSETSFDPLVNRRKYLILCHMHKILNNLTPKYLADYHLRLQLNYWLRPSIKRFFFGEPYMHGIYFLNSTRKSPPPSCLYSNWPSEMNLRLKTSQISSFNFPNYASVHQARMRIGPSALNFHNWKYIFISEGSCPFFAATATCKRIQPISSFIVPIGAPSGLLRWQMSQLSRITWPYSCLYQQNVVIISCLNFHWNGRWMWLLRLVGS